MINRETLAIFLLNAAVVGWQLIELRRRRRFENTANSDRRDIRDIAETAATAAASCTLTLDRLPWRPADDDTSSSNDR